MSETIAFLLALCVAAVCIDIFLLVCKIVYEAENLFLPKSRKLKKQNFGIVKFLKDMGDEKE